MKPEQRSRRYNEDYAPLDVPKRLPAWMERRARVRLLLTLLSLLLSLVALALAVYANLT